jgi:hypothetical protein
MHSRLFSDYDDHFTSELRAFSVPIEAERCHSINSATLSVGTYVYLYALIGAMALL